MHTNWVFYSKDDWYEEETSPQNEGSRIIWIAAVFRTCLEFAALANGRSIVVGDWPHLDMDI